MHQVGGSKPVRAVAAVVAAIALSVGAFYAQSSGLADADEVTPSGLRPVASPPTFGGRSISVIGAGDVLAHPELWSQARRDGSGILDFSKLFASVATTISAADLALCHLETPLAPATGPYAGFPRFAVPPEVVGGIKAAGFDGCSTGSNHSIDQGLDGITRTLNALDQAGLGHAGTARTKAESSETTMYTVRGVKVAHLSYAKYFNGIERPAGMEWEANLIEPAKVLEQARLARSRGAEIVIVSLHWGTEYEHEPDLDQQKWARAIAASPDIDLIYGHHAHVVQPVERISGKWVVYGMGNEVARHAEPINENREGVMVRVTFLPAGNGRWSVAAIEALPTFVDLNPDIRIIDLERALADPTITPGRRRIYEAAVERIRGHLLTRGAEAEGLVVRGTGEPNARGS